MEFESKMMYRLFWIEKDVIGVKEALFETRADAEIFKNMLETFKPAIDARINKWSWKVLIEK